MLDLTNAYGMFHRSGAIAEVRVSLPGLLGVVKAQWQNEMNSFWMRVDDRWVKSVTKRGGFQGLRFITVMFCLALKRSVREGRPVSGNDLAMPGYQDDCYLVGKLQSIADTWQNLASALAKGGHVVNPLKTEYWIPGFDAVLVASLPDTLRAFCEQLPRAFGGIKVMGCAAQGESETMLGPLQLGLAPATERLRKAKLLAKRTSDFIEGPSSLTSFPEAWCLARFSIRGALSYDTRIIPRHIIQPLLLEHADMMHGACEVILGRTLPPLAWARLQLLGPLSGMGLGLPLVSADAAYVATWQATEQRVETACGVLGRPIEALCDHSYYISALARLKSEGVVVKSSGDVEFTDAALLSFNAGPWSKDTSVKELTDFNVRTTCSSMGQGSKLHARIMRCINALQATTVHTGLNNTFVK